MKCPKCGQRNFKYKEKKKALKIGEETVLKRESNIAHCSKCGYEGVC